MKLSTFIITAALNVGGRNAPKQPELRNQVLSFDSDSAHYDMQVGKWYEMIGMADDQEYLENERTLKKLQKDISRMATPEKIDEFNGARKLRQLKILVLFLQKNKLEFGRYCYYGCHCLPDKKFHGKYDYGGKVLDKIDGTCKQWGVCTKCIKEKHGHECDSEEMGYKFDLIINSEKRDIDCSVNKNACKRDICECDKRLSERLAIYEDTWDESKHINRGNFSRDGVCKTPSPTVIELPAVVNGGGGGNNVTPGFREELDREGCCNLDDMPNVSFKKPGSLCCGGSHYDPYTQDCCPGNSINPFGMC